jgi:hypothetical protein
LIVSLVLALPAVAQPWYARGQFNNWPSDTSNQLTDQGGGHYSTTVSDAGDLCPDNMCEFKISNLDWSTTVPFGNGKAALNGSNEITFHLWDNQSWNDGWSPRDQRRIGYDDPGHGWELMGTFFDNFATPTAMTNQGSGVYHAQLPLDAGFYDFKFRKAGDWGINYGKNFENGSSNNSIRVFTDGDLWNFDLDLPNGRWRAYPTSPQPDRTGDEHADAADYVAARKLDGKGPATEAVQGSYGYSPWFMRGDFNGFNGLNENYLMTDVGNRHYTGTVSGLTPGQDYEYKLADFTFTDAYPSSNGKVRADAGGQINFHLWEQPEGGWNDGWFPNNTNRAGYTDHNQFDWEIIGSFNDFSTPVLQLTDQGNGVHSGIYTVATAGTYDFKFRQQGDWNTAIGSDFGNGSGNAQLTTSSDGEMWQFTLDLPNGRWTTELVLSSGGSGGVPEPSSMLLVVLGTLLVLGCQRRK